MAIQIGVQLYSVRKPIAQDPVYTLKRLMEIGFHHIEPANAIADKDPGIGAHIPADELKALLTPNGAYIGSAHMGPITDETLPRILEYHQSVGNRNIVVAIEFYTSYDHVMRRCEDYNRFGKFLVEHGMNPLSYHNHYHEYQILNGKPILDHILENTDPAYLNIEMDTGWVQRGGHDPISEMKRVGDRLRLIHIKDYLKRPANLLIGKEDELISWDTFGANNQPGDKMTPEDFVVLGQGMMPIQEILRTAESLGAEAAILEQDDTAIGIFDSLSQSADMLRTLPEAKL